MKIPLPKKHWFKHLFIGLHYLTISILLLLSALFYLAYRTDGLSLLSTYVLSPLGIHIADSTGSLSEGFSLHGLHSNAIDAKTLTLDYNLTAILNGEHVIDTVSIDGLQIHVDDFIGDSGTSLLLPLFKLKEVTLTNLQLISEYPIEVNIHGKNGTYDGEFLNFRSVQSSIKSRYASAALQGVVKNNILRGTALVYPNAQELLPTVGRFTALPRPQKIIIDALSDTRVTLHTAIPQLTSTNDPLTSLNALTLNMDYLYQNDYLDFTADYLLTRNDDRMQTHQKLRYEFNGVTTSEFKGVLASQRPLPSTILEGRFRDDPEGIAGKLTLGSASLSLQSSDYATFAWDMQTAQENLNFLPFLPQIFQNSPFSMEAKGTYTLENNQLQGLFWAHHNHADMNGSLRYDHGKFTLKGNLAPAPDAPLWNHWAIKPPTTMEVALTQTDETVHLNLNAPSVSLAIENTQNHISGSGSYLGTYFDLNGTTSDMHLTSLTPSLWKTLTQIGSIELPRGEYYDAEVRTDTHILYDTSFHVNTQITIPWYAAVLDTHRQYGGTDNTFLVRYSDNTLLLDRYRLDIAGHDITSQKPSTAHFDEHGNLIIDELWIYDALLLNGTIDTNTLASKLTLHSDRFTYKGPEGEAHAAMDLLFVRDTNAIQTLTGNVSLLNAQVTYLPLQQFKVMDDDVIILQDVRPPSNISLFMNVQVTAQQPLHYQTKELDILLMPELTVWKEPTGPVQILGMVTIPKGSATTSGKQFDIQNSHLYFAGGDSVNPYLDFTILHEVDYKKIHIYITHTLDSPIFLFNSDPFMSQNDIMSYLLFGSPADASLNSDGSKTALKTDATNFMLGAGVKGLINGATKIQIDTMNILTTQEGGMGIEVGTHLNKDLRVLYKNDTLSSILVQYQLNRWLRLDADIHALGQGINAIYIKDFRDFLPHNTLKKNK